MDLSFADFFAHKNRLREIWWFLTYEFVTAAGFPKTDPGG
jgi:hypothetical protein